MSSAFVKEPEGGEAFEDLPDRPISPHPNFVTPEGFSRIEAELERLHREHAAAQEADDKASLARTARDLRYWTARRNTAQVVTPPADAAEAHFGSTVTIEREDGRRQTFRIVGEDEADPAHGSVSYVSPLARALAGKSVGDVAQVAGGEVELVAVRHG
ncbi:MAG: transcription elongation factor GreA [Microvirga sp.]